MNVTREQYVQFLYNATLPYEERPGANQEPKRFANCKEANDAGFYDITRDSPYYGKHLDRDGDGIACEREKVVRKSTQPECFFLLKHAIFVGGFHKKESESR